MSNDISKPSLNITSQIKGLKIAIIGYASALVAPWDPCSCEKGLPGSEECVVYGSQELANRGHIVTIYMNPPEQSIWSSSLSNPRWLHVSKLSNDNTVQYDLVLMWRRFDVDLGRKYGKFVFAWLHDSPNTKHKIRFPNFDGVYVLINHHYKQLSFYNNFTTIPYIISGNGYCASQFTTPMRFSNSYSIGYFSNYARGLELLIDIWPKIRRQFPQATLDIYYGRETWNTMADWKLAKLITTIDNYQDLGVVERGKVGHEQLAQAMQQTSVWCYPCIDSGETFCITAVKCQAAGCIPVTTRIGALDETVHPDAPRVTRIEGHDDLDLYYKLVIDVLTRIRDDPTSIVEERQKYVEHAKQFDWPACIDKWLKLYEEITTSTLN